ncbi:hypothetical protein PV416_10365 [Streptomyces ipomoeae]|jgi:hypothetical protein|uniref:hypothetical protein n=1 Tax=Streptomyces ipomoeae TaxID=103232 RepID=UPI0029B93BB7|nr:hypothetical protein [Streptomyces ipomoeae]MDX2821482.1 hypothetical protein [Streptomyces ipomoeae]MDX2880945.1 hypothetical protein [Streptomyces ipomoeae]
MTGAAATSSGPARDSIVAIGKPTDSVLTVIIVAVVVLILLFLLLRHMIRKRGGWRRFRRRVGRELTLTRQAFGEPLRAYRRHRRGVRALARQLSDPRGGLLVRRLLDSAAAALADAPGAVPHAVRLEPGWASVQIAARRLPEPPTPWEPAAEPGPQRWELPLDDEDALPPGRTRAGAHLRPLPVAVGMADDACVHLDLAAGPRLITVEGDTAARNRLLQAMAAQLDRPGSGASVVVADGVHPQHRGERLDALLRKLETAAAVDPGEGQEPDEIGESGRAATTVVVCAAPTPEQARRLSALAASGAVVCLADGRVAGHTCALRVDGRGRVVAPELELDADSSPLGRAVVAAVRADRRRLRRESTPRRGTPLPRGRERQPLEAEETRELQETRLLEETEVLQEKSTEATAPIRTTTTGSGLLAEPDAARERTTAASSGPRED